MLTDHPLAETITKEAIGEFGRSVFHKDFFAKHGALMTSVPRFYAAAFAALENATSHYVDSRLKNTRNTEIQQAIRFSFSTAAYGLSAGALLHVSLDDLIVSSFERAAVEKNFRRKGHQGLLEGLMSHPTRFGSQFHEIQDIRCAEFVAFLARSPEQNLEVALRLSFSFWFFGERALQSDETKLATDIADSAEWAAAFAVDKPLRGEMPTQ